MKIFDGYKLASQKELILKDEVRVLSEQGVELKIAAILFSEDAGSTLYTGLKQEVSHRIGIEYEAHEFSLKDSVSKVVELISSLNQDKNITGIIIQKPTRSTWKKYLSSASSLMLRYGGDLSSSPPSGEEFGAWWRSLTSKISLEKDVDGLNPENIRVLPATVKAVLEILNNSQISLPARNASSIADAGGANKKILILNRSDILGKPLYSNLRNKNLDVEIWGSKNLLASKNACQDFDIIITGTGRGNLITGDMIKEGVILIDVGEPQGDIDFESVKEKASFITPVPGGVGPMTVLSLLENCVELVS